MSEPSEDRVERYAKAMRDVVGVARVSVFSGEFMDEFGRTVGYVGDSGAIFDDYARAAIEVANAEQRAAKVAALREFARHALKFKDGFYAAYWSAEAEIVAKEIEAGERD